MPQSSSQLRSQLTIVTSVFIHIKKKSNLLELSKQHKVKVLKKPFLQEVVIANRSYFLLSPLRGNVLDESQSSGRRSAALMGLQSSCSSDGRRDVRSWFKLLYQGANIGVRDVTLLTCVLLSCQEGINSLLVSLGCVGCHLQTSKHRWDGGN